MLPKRESGCVRAPKLRFVEVRRRADDFGIPALVMSARAEGIIVAAFAEIASGAAVVVALRDPEGLLLVEGTIAGSDGRGTRIAFTSEGESGELRERLERFGRRGLLLEADAEVA